MPSQLSPEQHTIKEALRATLHRFYRRYSQAVKQQDLGDAIEFRSDKAASLPLLEGSEDAVRHLAFQLSTAPRRPGALQRSRRWLTKQQYLKVAEDQAALARERVDLEKQRLDLDNRKFLFNAARAALEHHAELGEILKKDDLDSERRQNQCRPFSPVPDPNENSQIITR